MEEWKQYKLIEVLDAIIDYRGKTPKKTTSGVPLITAKIIKNGRIETPAEFISVDDYDSWMVRGFPKVGDVVLTTEAPLGEVAQLDDANIALAQRVVTLRGKSDVLDNTYLKYYFLSNVGKQRLKARETGTTVTGIKQSELREVLVDVPPYKVQVRIAEVLKSLDDKIEVNRRINDNLEQQAQALFKSWFVDFEPFRDQPFVESELGMIPEGWRVGTLFDVAEIFDKQRKPLSGKEREGMKRLYPYYGATSCMDYVDNYLFDGIYTLIGEDGSVAKEDGSPYMQYVWGKFWVNNHAHILQGKNGFSTEMIYVFLSITNIQHLVTGAVQAKLSQANMQKIVLAIPPKIVLNQVRPIIDSMYETRREREIESRRLSELRDTLLPRLMSGEIKVGDVTL